jgi:hypothetical protein
VEHFDQVMSQLAANNATGGDIVAVTESTGQAEDLIVVGKAWALEQPIRVHHVGSTASLLKRERRFLIAVSPGSSQNQYSDI